MYLPNSRAESFQVDNYATIYENVEQTWQDPQRARLYHAVLSKVLKPQVHFEAGAEDRIDQELQNGALCAIAFTHGSMIDPMQIAAMASNSPVFKPMVGKTMIGAKASLFATPIIGGIVPDLGAIPVWRKKDVLNPKQSPDEQDRLEVLRKLAGAAFIATEINGMEQGLHMVKHVEGTRNKENKQKILTVRDGYGKVVCGVSSDIDIIMVTAAFWYGDGSNKTNRKPTIYLDVPKNQRRAEAEEVTRSLSPSLQHCLDQAISLHNVLS